MGRTARGYFRRTSQRVQFFSLDQCKGHVSVHERVVGQAGFLLANLA